MKLCIGLFEAQPSFHGMLLIEQLEDEGIAKENIMLFQDHPLFWQAFCAKAFPIALSLSDKKLTLHSWAQDWIFDLPFALCKWKSVVQMLKQETFHTLCGLGIQGNSCIAHTPQGQRITLSMKEHQLLIYLIEQENQVISKEKIMQDVWGYEEGLETHTLETHVYDLRKKLEDLGPCFLKSKDGGYLLFADDGC